MKQQLKRLIAKEITDKQKEAYFLRETVRFYDGKADKADPSNESKQAFENMNYNKKRLRKVQSQLKKLRALQCEVKSMVGYMTSESDIELIVSNIKPV